MTPDHRTGDGNQQRDASSLLVLGVFFTILGLLVLVGTLWTRNDMRAAVVNAGSGMILVAVGVGTLLIGRRLARRKPDSDPSDVGPPR